ncbi:MAG: VOC family protein [Porticoccaceae bacterium]
MLDSVHHIAFVVKNLDAAVASYEKLLDIPMFERGPVPERGGEIAIFKLRNTRLELASPTGPGFLQDLLDNKGEGFFHIGFGVDDMSAAVDELQGKGINMSGPEKTIYKDWRIAYIDQSDTAGIYAHLITNDAE